MRSLIRSPYYPPRRSPIGFTLVELLVVIAIIGMLVALLVPAVNMSRGAARKNACLNNLKQLGMGITNYESNKHRFPGYVEPVRAVDSAHKPYFVEWVPGDSESQFVGSSSRVIDSSNQNQARLRSRISWAAHILPFTDNSAIWDVLVDADASEEQRRVAPIDHYICPDDQDIRSTVGSAGLSYVVNTGAWDFETNGNYHPPSENGDTKHNGLFHNAIFSNVKTRMSDIQDGASSTLMISENAHKNPNYSWLGVREDNPGEQQFGMVWVVNPRPESRCDGMIHQFNFGAEPDVLNFPHNSPCFARPYAIHSDTFNVIFADNHGTSLSPDIDYIVYQQILTPHGKKCVDPHARPNDAPSDAIKEFRNSRPITQADLGR